MQIIFFSAALALLLHYVPVLLKLASKNSPALLGGIHKIVAMPSPSAATSSPVIYQVVR